MTTHATEPSSAMRYKLGNDAGFEQQLHVLSCCFSLHKQAAASWSLKGASAIRATSAKPSTRRMTMVHRSLARARESERVCPADVAQAAVPVAPPLSWARARK